MTTDAAGPTIVDRLERAARQGGGVLVFHLDDGVRRVDAAELFDLARVRGGRLRRAGVGQGDRVGIVGPNTPEWVAWAHATWMRGAAIVPLPFPLRMRDRAAYAEQIDAMVRGFECTLIAAHERVLPLVGAVPAVAWSDVDRDADALAPDQLARIDDDTLARIMPTSGSTAAPKGVSRSYRLLNRRDLTTSVNRFGAETVRHLTYAPLSHAAASTAMFVPPEPWLEFHMLPPDRFAQEPGRLFRLVGPHRIMSFTATSSAIAAALRSIERDPADVDLSPLESLALGYEMVDPDVAERLATVGAKFGLRPESIAAFYGLSEGGGTRTAPHRGLPIDVVDLDALVTDGVAHPPAVGRAAKRVASCGSPTNAELRIVGPDGPLPERCVGEIQFRGPRLMQGYVGPGAEQAFVDGGWMHTGDTGYLAGGELYVTGRTKEVLVQQGKKYHPEDVEQAAARAAGVAAAACVAFAPVEGHEGDVVVEVEVAEPSSPGDLEGRIRAAVTNAVGLTLRAVVFVPQGTLPKTASGKAQRLAARDRYSRAGSTA